jgi:hypothetical protein
MSYHEEFENDDNLVPFRPKKKKCNDEPPEELCGRGHDKPCCTFTGGGDADEETHD